MGRITDQHYVALLRDFTAEQAQIKERLKLLEELLSQAESKCGPLFTVKMVAAELLSRFSFHLPLYHGGYV
ncbi:MULTISPECIES: hypothetical protein [Brevibacillus]|uniref:hypothetical protein n=1 Tax=Brevibacillus TaxID=55080 RepID=UPI00142E6A01|nr:MULTISPECIES: hypothetical protein [Brevibacillus]MBU8714724.1 hypothetical protein [Brevibacillus parabrevis]MDR5000589.1 hypothetical protein [Brevibacillus parabrevis]MED2253314.1 hypothetical protein [Brevibacillus parabrevis]NRQ55664.1 hypothetical protein [Brevibacillus sp. HD1.4A]UED70833.1 hypothetical protein HP435_09400 [Brevibacillus sp. HD3.3A]